MDEVLNNDKKNNKIQNETLIHILDSLKVLMANEKQSNFNHSTAISELNQELALVKMKTDSLNLMKND